MESVCLFFSLPLKGISLPFSFFPKSFKYSTQMSLPYQHLALHVKTFLFNRNVIKMQVSAFFTKILKIQILETFHCPLARFSLFCKKQLIIHGISKTSSCLGSCTEDPTQLTECYKAPPDLLPRHR